MLKFWAPASPPLIPSPQAPPLPLWAAQTPNFQGRNRWGRSRRSWVCKSNSCWAVREAEKTRLPTVYKRSCVPEQLLHMKGTTSCLESRTRNPPKPQSLNSKPSTNERHRITECDICQGTLKRAPPPVRTRSPLAKHEPSFFNFTLKRIVFKQLLTLERMEGLQHIPNKASALQQLGAKRFAPEAYRLGPSPHRQMGQVSLERSIQPRRHLENT